MAKDLPRCQICGKPAETELRTADTLRVYCGHHGRLAFQLFGRGRGRPGVPRA